MYIFRFIYMATGGEVNKHLREREREKDKQTGWRKRDKREF